MLLPFWQLVIGILVLVVVVASVGRLVQRGRSRMTTGLIVTGAAIVGLTALGMLFDGR
jgi:hypothetical protein